MCVKLILLRLYVLCCIKYKTKIITMSIKINVISVRSMNNF